MPPQTTTEQVTALLAASGKGDSAAVARLFSIIYDELHELASAYMRQERPDHTLQATALVHDAYLRLVHPAAEGAGPMQFENRGHFMATAAMAMRHILVNHAKSKEAQKRGGGRALLALDEAAAAFDQRAIDIIALDDALHRLAQLDPVQARLVELRFFGGMTVEECAQTLGMSERSVHYEWAHARAWLRSQLESV